MPDRSRWSSPLSGRYASPEMLAIFSDDRRIRTWRRLWLALAEAEAALGLPISEAQLAEIARHLDDVDHDAAARYERDLRHDVMAHVRALGDVAPLARPILHLGSTSCYVTDNADLIALRDATDLLLPKLAGLVDRLAAFARRWADRPALGFTHFQPAQPTTVGKRTCLWIQDLLVDLANLERLRAGLRLLGAKGATGTQASYLALFDGDDAKVEELDRRIAEAFGFPGTWTVTGQTYPRKTDHEIVAALSSFGITAHRIGTDLRLLAHLGEVEEPFGRDQVGSSAMAYKRNPMRSERACSLARHLVALSQDTAWTAATQWLERTLDDSANRRIALAEAFLCADGVLETLHEVAGGLVVHEATAERRLREALPFLVTENVLMEMTRAGADRQDAHEAIRRHAVEAARRIKDEGAPNDLVDRLRADPFFAPIRDRLDAMLDPRALVGRAPAQTRAFLDGEVEAALSRWRSRLAYGRELRV